MAEETTVMMKQVLRLKLTADLVLFEHEQTGQYPTMYSSSLVKGVCRGNTPSDGLWGTD